MSELFVVGISWRTAVVAVREKLAFRDHEMVPTLQALIAKLPVAEALLISTCNRVEVYGVAKVGADGPTAVRSLLCELRAVEPATVASLLYEHRGSAAVRHVFRVAAALDSMVVGEAQILGQLKTAYTLARDQAGTVGAVLSRCLERAFGVAKRVRTETTIARGAANVSSVAVELAARVFGELAGKCVLVVGAGKMSALAARHLYASGAQRIVVTNRSPDKAEALAAEIDGDAKPWADLEGLLVDADVVISSTGATEPVLTRSLFKRVARTRRWRNLVVIDIAVPRDAEPEINDIDGVYLFNIDDLDRVVAANLAEREKAAEHAAGIVEHEAGQFERWLRSQDVVPTIRALRERFAQVADAELQKAVDQLARKELAPEQQREVVQRLIQLVVNKLLHQPTSVLRAADPAQAELLAAAVCELFGLAPDDRADDVVADPARPGPILGAEGPSVTTRLVIATRGSQLALWQANHVKARIAAVAPATAVELAIIKTSGDVILDVPLAKLGGKGLFVKEIEQALVERTADLAVHSMKDVPAELAQGLAIAAVSSREVPWDALCARAPVTLETLPRGAKVGTSSLRRQAQLLARRPDLEIAMLRGNVPTRIHKLDAGEFDAIVLAAAGLHRLGMADRISQVLPLDASIPAVAQGVLAIEIRDGDGDVRDVVRAAIHDEQTAPKVAAERAFLARMGGSCQTPLAAHALGHNGGLRVLGMCGMPDGTRILRAEVSGATADARALGEQLAELLLAQGAGDILAATLA